MVYESDFYTTRRPYTRPTVSSYSVTKFHYFNEPEPYYPSYYPYGTFVRFYQTPFRVIPGISRVHSYTSSYPVYHHGSLPFVAHKRLTTASRIITSPSRVSLTPTRVIISPTRFIRSRPSVINREYERIENRIRHHGYSATEEYLNQDGVRDFDDETRDIRASTNALLRKINAPFPRASSVLPSPFSYSRYESFPSARLESYVSRIIPKSYQDDIPSNYNPEPSRKYFGKSHLASVRIVGDKAYDQRQPLTIIEGCNGARTRNNINVMSHYLKNRAAAGGSGRITKKTWASADTKAEAQREPKPEIVLVDE